MLASVRKLAKLGKSIFILKIRNSLPDSLLAAVSLLNVKVDVFTIPTSVVKSPFDGVKDS